MLCELMKMSIKYSTTPALELEVPAEEVLVEETPTTAAANAIDCVESNVPDSDAAASPKKKSKTIQPVNPPLNWHLSPLRLRTGHLLVIYGISQSVLYSRLREHQIPAPTGNDGRPWWISTDIARHVSGDLPK